jgi:uncharacterized protein
MIWHAMTQYKLSFISMLCGCLLGVATLGANVGYGAELDSKPAKKTVEMQFSDGLACLKKSDITCAQITVASIPSQSVYTKLLNAAIAAQQGDIDTVLRLLIPLQADSTLSPLASASLHLSLALAYAKQEDVLRQLEQRVLADETLVLIPASAEDISDNQNLIWQTLSQQSSADLIELRGNSLDTTIQGWIDLALAKQDNSLDALTSWRVAYPDHSAQALVAQWLAKLPAAKPASASTNLSDIASPLPTGARKVALLLPFASEVFYPVADALERGFMTAQTVYGGSFEIKVYPTRGEVSEIAGIYQQAQEEGAQFVVGPLTRSEVNTLVAQPLSLPTLTLNYADKPHADKNLYSYGLSADAEVKQIVKSAHNAGMQTATIVMGDYKLAGRIAQAFYDAWTKDGGQIKSQIVVLNDSLSGLKQQLASSPADMVFVAADAESARLLRPYLDIATPTYSVSPVFSGVLHNADDNALNAIHFVDMPWLLDANGASFNPAYAKTSQQLPPGEMQRWFALGADAYAIMRSLFDNASASNVINGLTGKITVDGQNISRELPLASFSTQGVVLESKP